MIICDTCTWYWCLQFFLKSAPINSTLSKHLIDIHMFMKGDDQFIKQNPAPAHILTLYLPMIHFNLIPPPSTPQYLRVAYGISSIRANTPRDTNNTKWVVQIRWSFHSNYKWLKCLQYNKKFLFNYDNIVWPAH